MGEVCWLIEADGKYWTAEDGMCRWIDDPWKAVRFSRQEDAERVRLTATASKISKAIQHSFDEAIVEHDFCKHHICRKCQECELCKEELAEAKEWKECVNDKG